MERESAYQTLMQKFPDLIKRNEPLSTYTTFKIGGPADLFCTVYFSDELTAVLQSACSLEIPAVLIGCGSNVLVDDAGFRGLVVKFVNTESPLLEYPYLTVSAGNSLKTVLEFAAEHSLGGLEFLAGIPGSVGGAIYMNAGAYGKCISDIIRWAVILDEDFHPKKVAAEFFQFSYRSSVLQTVFFPVVSAVFEITRSDSQVIRAEYERILQLRREKVPEDSIPSAGSFFKNLPSEYPGENRRSAGLYLEKAGAKQMRVGDAAVYEKHANIIINTGSATAHDVLKLADRMKTAVANQFHFNLEPEVRFLAANRGFNNPFFEKL